MIAEEMKILLMCYWRFVRGCPVVATEFDYGYADVIALSRRGRIIHETEVKVSITDMKADLRKPKHHHQQDLFGKAVKQMWANYFYFAVPGNIREEALKVCQELFPYAGLIVVGSYDSYLEKNARPYTPPPIEVIKKPQYLHAEEMDEERLFKLIKGMSNNLCCKAYELIRLKRKGE